MSQRADGIEAHETAMIENLLKFGCGLRVSAHGHQGFATHICRVQTAKIELREIESSHPQLIAKSGLQQLHTLDGLASPQRGQSAKHRDVSELSERVFREALVQVGSERL